MPLADRVVDKEHIKHLKCDYCHDIFANPQTLKNCPHVFCFLCIRTYIDSKIDPDLKLKKRRKIVETCPVDECQKTFKESDISTRMLQL